MQQVLKQMLDKYKIKNYEDKTNAIKEIIQEVVLCGLSRAGFFKDAAFYGGTALRIFYGLDRFSEDLDFTLCANNIDFDFNKYTSILSEEIKSFGLNCEIVPVVKTKESAIKSAFVKGNTNELMLVFSESKDDIDLIQSNAKIQIKFEVDTNPPTGAIFETKFGLLPSPYEIRVCDLSSLFAGKIHACLCRKWGTRVKGRDFYDYIFFLTMGARVNLTYLKSKLVESNYISSDFNLTTESLKQLLNKKFKEINFKQAKEDVMPFIKDKTKLDLWSPDFFVEITKKLQGSNE